MGFLEFISDLRIFEKFQGNFQRFHETCFNEISEGFRGVLDSREIS